MSNLFVILAGLFGVLVGGAAGYLLRRFGAEARIASAESEAARIVEEARRNAEGVKREALVEAREEVHRLRADVEREVRDRRAEVQRLESRLVQKEEAIDRKLESLERKQEDLRAREKELERLREESLQLRERQTEELHRISGLSKEEARELIMSQVREESRRDAALLMKEIESQAREEAERRAREVIAQAVQRCAAEHVAEISVSVVPLPNEEMKGRVIGREGRNIRTFEAVTGCDLIIDDTPEAVVVSAFDPVRREKARLTLEKLLADGRIHPARIEEMYEKAEREVEAAIRQAGEEATIATGVHNLHPELVKTLGRMKYRTSYGQNVLAHSVEVSQLAVLMANMLGADANVARRAGLLHDIGKAVDHQVEGTHVNIGIDLLRRYGEPEEVIHAMSTHHGEYEAKSVEAVIVNAADALSAARPGARRETLESYVKRLEQLEEIATSFAGVEKAYAIQAGREVRIIVKPEQVDDVEAFRMAKEISKRIENEMRYPGQIKVTVVRETRAVEYAR